MNEDSTRMQQILDTALTTNSITYTYLHMIYIFKGELLSVLDFWIYSCLRYPLNQWELVMLDIQNYGLHVWQSIW